MSVTGDWAICSTACSGKKNQSCHTLPVLCDGNSFVTGGFHWHKGASNVDSISVSWHHYPDVKVHGASMGPIWGRQDPVGPDIGLMNFAIWVVCAVFTWSPFEAIPPARHNAPVSTAVLDQHGTLPMKARLCQGLARSNLWRYKQHTNGLVQDCLLVSTRKSSYHILVSFLQIMHPIKLNHPWYGSSDHYWHWYPGALSLNKSGHHNLF